MPSQTFKPIIAAFYLLVLINGSFGDYFWFRHEVGTEYRRLLCKVESSLPDEARGFPRFFCGVCPCGSWWTVGISKRTKWPNETIAPMTSSAGSSVAWTRERSARCSSQLSFHRWRNQPVRNFRFATCFF